LDHLRIVQLGLSRILASLGKGEEPEGTLKIADVKPDVAVTESVIAEYEATCEALLIAVAAVPDLKTKVRYAHPWFGPLNAFEWFGLAGFHLAIHRKQIERILTGLQMPSK
jgi:hypothetical protein